MTEISKKIAKDLLKIQAVFLSPDKPFTWASGIKSPVYCDNRLTLTAPEVRTDVENGLKALIEENYPDAEVLMGTSTAGIALAVPAYLVTKGNLPRMIILATIGVPIFLLVGTAFAPFISHLATSTGAVAAKALGSAGLISNSSIDGPWFTYAFSQFLDIANGNPLPLGMLIVWLAGYGLTYHDLSKEQKARKAAASAEAVEE